MHNNNQYRSVLYRSVGVYQIIRIIAGTRLVQRARAVNSRYGPADLDELGAKGVVPGIVGRANGAALNIFRGDKTFVLNFDQRHHGLDDQ